MPAKGKSEREARDTGMAMVLICLLAMLVAGPEGWLPAAIVLLVVTMTWPKLFKPLAGFWFGLSHQLGKWVSKLILTLLFFIVVTPVAFVRQRMGADPLQLKWQQNKARAASAFIVRDKTFSAEDLERPY